MTWIPPTIDPAHALYQPSKRAKRGMSEYHRRQVAQALDTAIASRGGQNVTPDPHGSTAQKEAWMRQRQRLKVAEIEHQREQELLREANSEVQNRRANKFGQNVKTGASTAMPAPERSTHGHSTADSESVPGNHADSRLKTGTPLTEPGSAVSPVHHTDEPLFWID